MPDRRGTTFRAVLRDFGNVIVRWNPRTLYQKIFPDPVECDRFLSQVCTLAWHAQTDCGVSFAHHFTDPAALWPALAAGNLI